MFDDLWYSINQVPGDKGANYLAAHKYSTDELLKEFKRYDLFIFTETDTNIKVDLDWSRIDLKNDRRIFSDGNVHHVGGYCYFSITYIPRYKLEEYPNLHELVSREEYADICITEILMNARVLDKVKFELLEMCEREFIVCMLLIAPYPNRMTDFTTFIEKMHISNELYSKVFEILMIRYGHYLEYLNPERISSELYHKLCVRALKLSKNNFQYIQEKYLTTEHFDDCCELYLKKCILHFTK